ncbi:hypothetical protein BU15DRAFT_68575 [Melanogaster broomeanus]|nr:hypothetical protein BU15DRAFT_68575 [Melanogaster broomeanus]
MARDILKKFVVDGVVEVCEGKPSVGESATILDKKSEAVQRALDAAFEAAKAHGCIRSHSDAGLAKTPPAQAVMGEKAGKASKVQPHFWRWKDFPKAPLGEDALVEFLNKITDSARIIVEPQLGDVKCKVRNRFAAPEDKYHGVPLAYEADGEDMRPDFLVLPLEGFSSDMKTVDQKYVNFTALRAVGESKNKDFRPELTQVHRYARGMRRAQPWVHFVLAMAMTKDRMSLVHGDSSGTERLELVLSNGHGCIEFIRIVLGLALAEGIDLGQNTDVDLRSEERSCIISTRPPPPPKTTQTHNYRNSQAAVSSSDPPSAPASLSVENSSEGAVSSSGQASYTSGASVPSHSRSSAGISSSSKRKYSEVDDGADGADDQPNLPKKGKQVERITFIPIKVYGHECVGILFTAGSIRGRGTVVFCVVDLDDNRKFLALKTSWQDLQREEERDDVLERLNDKGQHPNLIVPLKDFKARTKNDDFTTLGTIRAFLGDQLGGFPAENRVLSVSVSELKRPVKYFWGVHDFVRGLRGHEYLTQIGILHRDISKNNIILGRRPGEEMGYLIDFDMAILQEPEEPTEAAATSKPKGLRKVDDTPRSSSPIQADESKPIKALRTGTTSYMSMNVLYGGRHTYFDDMESFLYLVLLFFFSYAGPLSKEELRTADAEGFVQLLGSGRLSHTRSWPEKYTKWAGESMSDIAEMKDVRLASKHSTERLIRSVEVRNCLKANWPTGLHAGIRTLLATLWDLFVHSRLTSGLDVPCTQVKHSELVGCLDEWLAEYSGEEEEFSNCPFVRHVIVAVESPASRAPESWDSNEHNATSFATFYKTRIPIHPVFISISLECYTPSMKLREAVPQNCELD